jgi:6-phosphofructokinase
MQYFITKLHCPKCDMGAHIVIAPSTATESDWDEMNSRIAIFRSAHKNHGVVVVAEQATEP